MFSGLSSGLWWFGNPGLGYNVCMAPDGVDFAASAGKYHNHQAKALGMPLLSSWVLLGPGGSGLSVLRFAVCCGMRAAWQGGEVWISHPPGAAALGAAGDGARPHSSILHPCQDTLGCPVASQLSALQ